MNKKDLTILIAAIIIAPIVAWYVLSSLSSGNGTFGQLTPDTVRGGTNTYTSYTASSGASMALDINTARAGLEIQNTGATNAVRVYLQATSTGVTSTNGIYLAPNGGSYTPEFTWPGQVWVITPSGTSSVVIQSTIR